ncbi:MAG: succinylglutamate desuccinylase/aspartoacylase family protein [Candidatus Bathyarchaeia archaeon]|jgi:predicted deacylase
MVDVVKIGNLEAQMGEKKTGYLNVGETAVGIVQIPVAIINGAKLGPVLCISGGVHGSEYSSIEAVIRVISQTDPSRLAGKLIVIPVLNMAGFETRGPQGGHSTPFQNPIDCINLNRIFPGNPEGTMSYQIAAAFTNIVSKADYYVDCHGGDLNEELTSHVVVAQSGDVRNDKLAQELLAASFDCDFQYVHATSNGGGSIDAAAKIGIPSIAVEAGGFGRVSEEAVMFINNGIINIMKKLNMIEGPPLPTRKPRTRRRWLLYATRGGICYVPPLGTKIKKGDKVAEIRSLFGDVLETLESPVDGYVCFRRSPLPISTNDRVVGIIPDEDIAPPKPRPYP